MIVEVGLPANLFIAPMLTAPTSGYSNTATEVVYRAVLVALLVLLVPLIGRFWEKKGCPPLETLAQQQICDRTYARDWKRQLDLKLRGQKDAREAGDHDDAVAALDQKSNDLTKDMNQLTADINQWNSQWPAGGGDPPGGVNLSVYGDLTARLGDLQGEIGDYNNDAADANKVADQEQAEKTSFKADKAALLVDLDSDDKAMKKLKCIKCIKVGRLIPSTQALPEDWPIDQAVPLNPNFPPINAPPTPPQVPPPPPQQGTQEKCKMNLSDKVVSYWVGAEVQLSPFVVNPHLADTVWVNRHYGKDYAIVLNELGATVEINQPIICLSGSASGTERHELTTTDGQGAVVNTQKLDYRLEVFDYEWELQSAKVTDPKYDPQENGTPSFMLEDSNRLRSTKVSCAKAVIPVEIEKLYAEWLDESNLPHFESKLLDFEVNLTLTVKTKPGLVILKGATTGSGQTGTGAAQPPTKTYKVVLKAKGVKRQDGTATTNDYDFTVSKDPNDPAPADLTDDTPWFEYSKTNRLEFPTKDITLMSGDYFLLNWRADWLSKPVTFYGRDPTGQCAAGQLQAQGLASAISSIPPETEFHWRIRKLTKNAPAGPASFFDQLADWGIIGFDDYQYYSFSALIFPPEVDEDTDYVVEFIESVGERDLMTNQSAADTVIRSFKITVKPFKNIMDWYNNKTFNKKLVANGVLKAGQEAAIQMYHPVQDSLWQFCDGGMHYIALTIKTVRGVQRINKLTALAGNPIYPTFELSNLMPPEFADIPQEEFGKLHPLKRVTEPLALSYRLAQILPESTGPDYFYSGGSSATAEEAWNFYVREVYKIDPTNPRSPWKIPSDPSVIEKMTGPVKIQRLQLTCTTRFNDLCRIQMAYEQAEAAIGQQLTVPHSQIPPEFVEAATAKIDDLLGSGKGEGIVENIGGATSRIARELWTDAEAAKLYKPKFPILGKPKHYVVRRPFFPQEPKPLPLADNPSARSVENPPGELVWEYKETTLLGTVDEYRLIFDVDVMQSESGVLRVLAINKISSFLPNVGSFQRRAVNEYLATVSEEMWQAGVSPGATLYSGGTPGTFEEYLAEINKNIELAKQGKPIPAPRTQPGAQTMEATFGASMRLDTWKNWALNTALESFKLSLEGAAFGALTYTLTNAYQDASAGAERGGSSGAIQAFARGLVVSAVVGAVSGPFLTLLQRFVVGGSNFAVKGSLLIEASLVDSVLGALEAYAATTAERQVIERTLVESLVWASSKSFIVFRMFAAGTTRIIPVVGWALLAKDLVVTGYSAYVELTKPDDIANAWKNRLWPMPSMQIAGGIFVTPRGIQVNEDMDDRAFYVPSGGGGLTPSGQLAGSGIAGDQSQETALWAYNMVPRSTVLWASQDDIRVEFGNEAVGPKTEGLPQYMRDLLPTLPFSNMGIPDIPATAQNLKVANEQEPYNVMEDMWYFRYAFDAWIAEKDKEFMKLQAQYGKGFDKPVASEAERSAQRDQAALKYWSKWRDRYATNWISMTVGKPQPYRLFWWKDFNGKQCTVMERGGLIIMQPHVDLSEIIKTLGQ